jgi:hypothetical protein
MQLLLQYFGLLEKNNNLFIFNSNQSNMKKFIKNVLIFSFFFFLVDKLFYPLLIILPSLESDNRLEKLVNGRIDKDIIILGSSRGARGLIAKQIEDSLDLSVYNLSYPGSNIEFHEFLLQTLLKFNNKPKVVLLVVDDKSELMESSLEYRYDRLYPLSKYSYINNEMIERKKKTYLSKGFILSRLNRSNFDLRKKRFSKLDTIAACGSMIISFQKKDMKWIFNNLNNTYDKENEVPAKIDSYLNFQRLCTSNNIKLVVVFPPNFKSYNSKFEERLRTLSNRNTVFYTYDTLNIEYKYKSFYYDESHLQRYGASIFTNEIIEQLRKDEIQTHNKAYNGK